ncbi:MAG: UDP-glucose 4-epimerase GalE [Nitrospirae bacterium GWC2_57_13]|nr:MAG: UDP-glucose 4-epimerase GalE [Nitrospirae bacterium GWC2_57_13]OGW45755.1 MAG: UDP-glucose 4-epimerase GalE [Nitrospirae bacterium GWD2_57_8]HAS53284.1 UDP-glucose 4-epimerase GalE [Nitrospiraceae bacterium]
MKILVTGGAGYIGSHVVKQLGEYGHDILVYDNLSKGHRNAVLHGRLVIADLADAQTLDQTFVDFRPDAVMHFAAFIEVAESVREPAKYYRNNTGNTLALLESILRHDVRTFIFSSTAAVYGTPGSVPIPETAPLKPINPYGRSKFFVEEALQDLSASQGLKYISLRYFNAAGADEQGRIGERHEPESHLIPLTLKTAKGVRESISIYGTDYPTPDNTCIRDYIHVDDLAAAHILALEYLAEGSGSDIFNCGYGHGYSVKEVLEMAKKVTGFDFKVDVSGRRTGDPPLLVADSAKMRKQLNWKPRHDDLEYIIRTAWNWEQKAHS